MNAIFLKTGYLTSNGICFQKNGLFRNCDERLAKIPFCRIRMNLRLAQYSLWNT